MGSFIQKGFSINKNCFFRRTCHQFLDFIVSVVRGEIGDNLYLFIPLLVAIVFHVFYLPIMLFTSLKTEAGQLHLWLHNPQSAATLLLSKILNGIIMTVVSLVVLYLMAGLLIISRFSLIEAYWTDTWMAGLLIFPHIIMISMILVSG